MFNHGTLRPPGYLAGAPNYYIPEAAAWLWASLTGLPPTATKVLVLARGFSILLLSSAMPILVALCTQRLSSRKDLAAWAGFFATVSPLVLGLNRIHYPDHYLGALAAAYFYFCIRILEGSDSLKDYLAAGAMLGLCASTKYSAGLLLPAIALAHVQYPMVRSGVMRWLTVAWHAVRDKRIWLFGVAALIVFVILNYYGLVVIRNIKRALAFHEWHYTSGHGGLESRHGVIFYLAQLFVLSFGVVGAALVLIGSATMWKKHRRAFIFIATLLAIVIVMLGRYKVVINRNVTLVLPLVFILIAYGWDTVLTTVRQTIGANSRIRLVAATAVLFILVMIEPMYRNAVSLINDFQPDARVAAQQWIDQNVEPSKVFGYAIAGWGIPLSQPPFTLVNASYPSQTKELEAFDYYLMDSWRYISWGRGSSVLSFMPISEHLFLGTGQYEYGGRYRMQNEFLTHLELVREFPASEYYGPGISIYKKK
jgi:4-amino-4-deoxy-L-arabinose transferase-like glycosyltransferase